ncbi:hypothetical protein EV200_104526 [Pedobacter psychrotolerans]|uniref:Uncharacterized protein n=1 Tax=Pedobacter psychrotolerans TaxID=1843235 RepID=A0A4R2HCI0_9SPHI|nr:hypothetical protein [Pedobacter psychrotolerans]TCO25488.1 hypothetical protein EV200_104526 [Pedobacter psychrotolerans]GGE45064.1 hypothetical protein GCM10011413_08990 [Pedobacter psychrotolerans]
MTNQQTLNPSKLRIRIILMTTALILSIPLVAMQFTKEVNWTLSDFVIAAVLLLSTGLAIELVIRYVKTNLLKTMLLVIILLLLFITWVELAVGIFGTPFAGS